MSDANFRTLERQAQLDPSLAVTLLTQKLRTNQITREKVIFAAFLGHEPSKIILGNDAPKEQFEVPLHEEPALTQKRLAVVKKYFRQQDITPYLIVGSVILDKIKINDKSVVHPVFKEIDHSICYPLSSPQERRAIKLNKLIERTADWLRKGENQIIARNLVKKIGSELFGWDGFNSVGYNYFIGYAAEEHLHPYQEMCELTYHIFRNGETGALSALLHLSSKWFIDCYSETCKRLLISWALTGKWTYPEEK